MKILITGGSSIVNNIGDQAMIFTLIEYIRKHNPDTDIVLFDEDAYFNKAMQDRFKFRILPDIPMEQKLKRVNRLFYHLFKILNSKKQFSKILEDEIVNEYKTCDHIYQLAGFSMSSQMIFKNNLSRIWDIALAKRLGKKITMLPQSIGPFDFSSFKKPVFLYYLKKYINYPEFVLCRESMGKVLLEKYGCRKVKIEHDLVLSRPDEIDPSSIYRRKKKAPHYEINKHKDTVIIPNFRFLQYRSKSEICDIYETIINKCLEMTGGRVCLFNHVKDDDGPITRAIFSRFKNSPDVFLVDGGFDCVAAEYFFSRFSIGIVARWHAYVHVIRAGLPYVAIGWAEKYHETARLFDNKDVVFDIREPFAEKNIISAIEWVYNNRNEISEQLIRRGAEIRRTFCLDRIIKDI